jgi:hypothetical protein
MGSVRPKDNGDPKCPKRDTLDKYLKVDMPEIHDAHVLALFELVDWKLIVEWDSHPERKLAIVPFGIEINSKEQLRNVKDLIFAAVAEITQSQTLGVSAPTPNEKALSLKRYPTTFLVYNLSEEQCQTLQQRTVWASLELTFRAAPTDPCRPNFLFTIADFTTMDISEVQKLVTRVWKDEVSQDFFNSLTQAMDTDDQAIEPPLTHEEIEAFIDSLHISVIKLLVHVPSPTPENPKASTATLKPRFNILVDSTHIRDFQVWTDIRLFLAKRSYQTAVLGQGTTHIAPHNCGICHGADHPRGLCPFPSLPGWSGPKCRTNEYRGRADTERTTQFPRAKRQRI